MGSCSTEAATSPCGLTLVCGSTAAPCLTRTWATLTRSSWAARCSGLRPDWGTPAGQTYTTTRNSTQHYASYTPELPDPPTLVQVLVGASLASSSVTTSRWPSCAPKWSAVTPCRVAARTEAPNSSSAVMISSWFLWAAMWSGVKPFWGQQANQLDQ